MTVTNPHEALLEPLLTILDGLVPLHVANLADPGEYERAQSRKEELADVLGESADRLVAPENFRHPDDRRRRGQALNAAAACLALGAYQYGGITWAGRHWCVKPHTGCPYPPASEVFGEEPA